ncbi:MAG: PRC-barrel domain-containing protein [Chloroflexota bacterium]|nr:PRC-barrel domain-containing protein [Actinomycetota bacterium]MDQ6675535.1 PRC-barrel domain-containing protein [Chloroflexota bacterium]
MRVDLDAKVRTRDGKAAGSVQRAIIDPMANEVSDFVISTGGLFGHDVIVPHSRLEAAVHDGDTIRLDLTRDELKEMPEYAPADYTVPAAGWVPPVGYGYPLGGFLWPAGYAWPEQSATGRGRGEGEGELWPAIDKGTVVRDRAGDEVGVVEDLRFDRDSGRLQGLIVRAGGTIQTFFGGGDTREIEMSQVERVGEGNVYLRLDRNQVTRVPD